MYVYIYTFIYIYTYTYINECVYIGIPIFKISLIPFPLSEFRFFHFPICKS